MTTFADVVDPGDPKVSLREAIALANTTAEPDTIQLKADVYSLSMAGAGEDGSGSGDFDITSPLTLQGQGTTKTFIDGAYLDRRFHMIASFDVTFSQVTLGNGFGPILPGDAIFAPTANAMLNKSTVRANLASEGGGIYAGEGNLILDHSTVSNNVATGNGGGIFVGEMHLTSSTVSGNRASGDAFAVLVLPGLAVPLLDRRRRPVLGTCRGAGPACREDPRRPRLSRQPTSVDRNAGNRAY